MPVKIDSYVLSSHVDNKIEHHETWTFFSAFSVPNNPLGEQFSMADKCIDDSLR